MRRLLLCFRPLLLGCVVFGNRKRIIHIFVTFSFESIYIINLVYIMSQKAWRYYEL